MPLPGRHIDKLADAYAHDLLSPAQRGRVDAHVARCPACQAVLATAQQHREALAALPAYDATEALIHDTERRIRDAAHPRPSRLVRGALAAAAIAAILLIGVSIYYSQLSPSRYDLRVLGPREWRSGTPGALRLAVIQHPDGAGAAGVPVEATLTGPAGKSVTLASFVTDGNGSGDVHFAVPEWADGEYQLDAVARTGWIERQRLSRTVVLRQAWQVLLSTDRPVYQPGQTILLRGLALRRPDLHPVAGATIRFTVADPKGNVIFRREQQASAFGIASAQCPLAEEITEGVYRLECQVGEDRHAVEVEVKTYVLPKFTVTVAPNRPYYRPGDVVEGRVKADYLFGKPVADAAVTIDVTWAGNGQQLTARTDEQGLANFKFPLPAAGLEQARFQAKVVDAGGLMRGGEMTCPVSVEPIHIDVIPEAGKLARGLANRIYLVTRTPDGRPTKARLEVIGHGGFDTDQLGVAELEVTPTGTLRLDVTARDDAGQTGHCQAKLPCAEADDDFLLRTDRAVYDGGATLRLTVAAVGTEPVFVDLVRDGQTLMTEAIAVAKGRGERAVTLPPEVFGTLRLRAYRLGTRPTALGRARTIYIRPAQRLTILPEADQPEYRPGGTARLTFRLLDEAGQPCPGALSLAAVDEAVFALVGQTRGRDLEHFTVDRDSRESLHTLQSWSPGNGAAEESVARDRLTQALFARTANDDVGIGSREEFLKKLLPFVENNRNVFAVLESPGWEERIGDMITPEALALLRDKSGPHPLNASTYPGQVRQTEAKQAAGLRVLGWLWTGYLSLCAIGLFLFLAFFVFKSNEVAALLTMGATAVFLLMCLVPATQNVREASARTQTVNDLKQISLAIESYRDVHKKLPDVQPRLNTSGREPPRVRQWFPETLLWRPELITDDHGVATLDVPLADSITTWRLTASAVSAAGRLGGSETSLRVFQPFFVDLNLPAALTRGDEVAVPAVVYNYLDRPQTVTLTLDDAPAFNLLDEPTRRLELAAGEVRPATFRLRAKQIGRHTLQITARAGDLADAVRRPVEVVSDGRKVETVASGTLRQPAEVDLTVPADAIDGSVRAAIRLYPSTFSQVVEGLDNIFQAPHGCFEQTSSTTYPNVLALDYLRRQGKSLPAVEDKARRFIHLGCQRLLSFEVAGGGFDWFGRPPANRILTAYGLMEFEDMAKVHDVDQGVIDRTRRWLLGQRRPDGSWEPESHHLHEDPVGNRGEQARLGATAYVAWAVFGGGRAGSDAGPTLAYLLRHEPATLGDPYTVALVASALLALDSDGGAARPYLDRLATLKKSSPDGSTVWWARETEGRTLFCGAGRGGEVETTALAALALLAAGREPALARGALTWLCGQKDAHGTWHSTQATVLALKALLAGTGRPLGGPEPRQIRWTLDGKPPRDLKILADQAEVVQAIDLSPELAVGRHRLRLEDGSASPATYQVVLRYHLPEAATPSKSPLGVQVSYDKRSLKIGDQVTATVTVKNHRPQAAPMVMIELPIPPGFTADMQDFTTLVEAGRAEKVQHTAQQVTLYLSALEPDAPLILRYHLRAVLAGQVTAPAARVYEYYDSDTRGRSETHQLAVGR